MALPLLSAACVARSDPTCGGGGGLVSSSVGDGRVIVLAQLCHGTWTARDIRGVLGPRAHPADLRKGRGVMSAYSATGGDATGTWR